jgi:manganese/zinc/iron transport system ATP- binding protein
MGFDATTSLGIAAPRGLAPPLAVRGLSVSYGATTALDGVDWTSPPSGRVAIVGPNGAGKSSFVKAVLGLVPHDGEVSVFGRPLSETRARTAYTPQRAAVDWSFPARALDVVLQGMLPRTGWFAPLTRAHREAARTVLARVGMADLAERQIGALSGGQQQRVFIARALAREADLLVLDEPLAGVDKASERAILDVMAAEARAGRLVLVVHHDLSSVASEFDHVLLLAGRRVADGPVASTFTAANVAQTYGVPVLAR